MPPTEKSLSELITLRPRFLRSVNLERDFYASDALDGYYPTASVRSALNLLSRAAAEPAYRAQSLTGPYGSGKSALALVFARLCSGDNSPAAERLRKAFGPSASSIGESRHLPILAIGSRESLGRCLAQSLRSSLEKAGQTKLLSRLMDTHKRVFNSQSPPTRGVVALVEDTCRQASRNGSTGLLVVIDELGKLLEYAASHPDDSDIQLLQDLAEAAARSGDAPLILVTVLHQGFSHYAQRLGRRYQKEWDKVQQRFYEAPCYMDAADSVRLVAAALSSSSRQVVSSCPAVLREADRCQRWAPRGTEDTFVSLALDSYPIHPTVLGILPAVMRRYGQNERSLFSFLSAEEPFSLVDFAHRVTYDPRNPPYFRIPDLYDYVHCTMSGGLATQTWSEVEDALARLQDAGKPEQDVLKTVGLISTIGDSARVSASREFLCDALAGDDSAVSGVLDQLMARRMIVFRRWRGAYKIWEGSDVDMEERLEAAREACPEALSAAITVARDLCPSAPLAARKHSLQKGMPRSFAVVACRPADLDSAAAGSYPADGVLIQCLAESLEEAEQARAAAAEVTGPSVIIEVARESDDLREAAVEVSRLEWIRLNTPALAGDRVARRELDDRRTDAEAVFRSEWRSLFGAGAPGAEWFWQSEPVPVPNTRALSELLSRACDETFRFAPTVNNELINRRRLSSAAAKARRNLVEAMLTRREQPLLGFEGFPPERSIYESLLLGTGIHRQVEGRDQWTIGSPDGRDSGMQAAWERLEEVTAPADLKPVRVSDVLASITAPPFGVADGFAPVLLTAFLIANESTTALYEAGSFVPEVTAPALERLMRRPEVFTIATYALEGERQIAVERFARGYGVAPSVLPVVRFIYKAMAALPQYTANTGRLSPRAAAVRTAIAMSRSPERLLFVELPKAVGCGPLGPECSDAAAVETLFERLNEAFGEIASCYDRLLDRIQVDLRRLFDVADGHEDWRAALADRAEALLATAADPGLVPVLLRVKDRTLAERQYLESVAAGIAGVPPNRWRRDQEQNFGVRLRELAAAVRAAEAQGVLAEHTRPGEDGWLLSVDSTAGSSVRRIVRVSPAEREAVKELAGELLRQGAGGPGRARVLLAALAEAARALIKNQEEDADGQGDSDASAAS